VLRPPSAEWVPQGNGSLAILRYDDVRNAADPKATLLEFFQSAYEAGASLAGWDLADTATPWVPGSSGPARPPFAQPDGGSAPYRVRCIAHDEEEAMGRISTYLQVSMDGYFAGPNGEIDWFKNQPDPEFEEFSLERARGSSTLLFGRTTYEMMASAWPSDEAHEGQPGMADVMAKSPKIVFSKSLRDVEEGPRWQNVELRRDIDADDLRNDDRHFTTLGSGSIVQQLTQLGVVDEYAFVVNPILLGSGKNAFAGIDTAQLDLSEARSFKNGLVWLTYQRR
jgi:dihydrofolate reductase